MKDEIKSTGRGQFAIRTWEDIRKSGGISYSPEQIEAILTESDDKMLTRLEVKNRISAYFQSCMCASQDEETGVVYYSWQRNPTKSALALSLGISVGTLCDYVKGMDRHKNPYRQNARAIQRIATEDFDLVRKAYILIEDFYEQQLGQNKNNSGSIFWLLNRENTRWSNEQEFKFGMAEPEEKEIISGDELPKLIAEKYTISKATGRIGE